MFDIGFWEIILIAVITLLVVGPQRMPEIARKAGYYVGRLRRFLKEAQDQVEKQVPSEEIGELKKQLSLGEEKNTILEIVKEAEESTSTTNQANSDNK